MFHNTHTNSHTYSATTKNNNINIFTLTSHKSRRNKFHSGGYFPECRWHLPDSPRLPEHARARPCCRQLTDPSPSTRHWGPEVGGANSHWLVYTTRLRPLTLTRQQIKRTSKIPRSREVTQLGSPSASSAKIQTQLYFFSLKAEKIFKIFSSKVLSLDRL